MNDNLATVLTIIFSAGGAAALTAFSKGLRSFVSGRAADERDRIQRLTRERDEADAYRRAIAEHASLLRGLLNENGLGNLVPEWPANPTTTPTRRSRRNG